MLARLLTLMRNSVAAPGQQLFSSSGTFTVPAGVTSICAVAVGRGQSGTNGDGVYAGGAGGAGGTLSYANSISVTPGESLTVTIATSTSSSTGETTLKRSSTVLLAARAGGQTSGQANEGTSFAGGTTPAPLYGYGSGGGGAGGYSAAGGNGGGGGGAGSGGSAGASGGVGGAGGAYGGGGGGGAWNSSGGNGGSGGLRIIWGAGRSYPSTNTGDV